MSKRCPCYLCNYQQPGFYCLIFKCATIKGVPRKTTWRGVPMNSFFKDLSPEEISALLSMISEREAKVISLRCGIDSGKPRTREEVAKMFNVTSERIRLIEAKAIRKLRHPNRTRLLKEYQEGRNASLDKDTIEKNIGKVSVTNTSFQNLSDRVKEKSEIRPENVTDRIEKLTGTLYDQGMPYKEIKYLFSLSQRQLENIKAMTSIEELLGYTKTMNPVPYLADKADTEDVISALEHIAYGSTHKEEFNMEDAVKAAIQRLETKQTIETKQKQRPMAPSPDNLSHYVEEKQVPSHSDYGETFVKIIVGLVVAIGCIFSLWLQIKLAILLFPIIVIAVVISIFAFIFQKK